MQNNYQKAIGNFNKKETSSRSPWEMSFSGHLSEGWPKRIKAFLPSFESSALIGEQGRRHRQRQIQIWVIFWRILTLLQILAMAHFCPEQLGSVSWASLVFTVTLFYTASYAYVISRPKLSRSKTVHIADLAACASLMFLAREPKLIFILSLHAYSSLFSFPAYRLKTAIIITVSMSLAYLGAEWFWGITPLALLTSSPRFGSFAIFYIAGLGAYAFATVLEEVSRLEIDTLLEKERLDFYDFLHNKLGGTIFGLRMGSRCLEEIKDTEGLRGNLEYLNEGCDRAFRFLGGIRSQLSDTIDGDLNSSLYKLSKEYGHLGIKIKFVSRVDEILLSSAMQHEIFSLIREAVKNAAKHSGTSNITICIKSIRTNLNISIKDNGKGFDKKLLEKRQAEGGWGIIYMQERIEQLGGKAKIESGLGSGTRVEFEVPQSRSAVPLSDAGVQKGKQNGGIYTLLLRLQASILALVIGQSLLLPYEQKTNIALLALNGLLAADCFVLIFFRHSIYQFYNSHRLFLIAKQVLYAGFFAIALQADLPVFLSLYVGVSLIMSGIILGLKANTFVGVLLDLGVLVSYFLGSRPFSGQMAEDFITYGTCLFLVSVSGGLAGEFVKSLETLKNEAKRRMIAGEKKRLAASAHEKLHSLIMQLKNDVLALRLSSPKPDISNFKHVLDHSEMLEKRLRETMSSLGLSKTT